MGSWRRYSTAAVLGALLVLSVQGQDRRCRCSGTCVCVTPCEFGGLDPLYPFIPSSLKISWSSVNRESETDAFAHDLERSSIEGYCFRLNVQDGPGVVLWNSTEREQNQRGCDDADTPIVWENRMRMCANSNEPVMNSANRIFDAILQIPQALHRTKKGRLLWDRFTGSAYTLADPLGSTASTTGAYLIIPPLTQLAGSCLMQAAHLLFG